tara:strand:+ start:340 stop:543 length:204 start_codon:yes stop_codon:yes gene_type:complete
MKQTFFARYNATQPILNNFNKNLEKISAEFRKNCNYGQITKKEFKAKVKEAKGKISRATYFENGELE